MDYAASEVFRAMDAGPAEGEDFFRMAIGKSKWVNVTREQALAIAFVLDFDSYANSPDNVIGSTIRALLS